MPRETKIGLVVFLAGLVLASASSLFEEGSRSQMLFVGGGGACLFAGAVYAFLTWMERPRPEPKSAGLGWNEKWSAAVTEYEERQAAKKDDSSED